MKIFSVNKQTQELQINIDVVRAIPEFRAILRRLRKVEGDHDGRKKLYNFRELLYVFYMADWTDENPKAALSDADRHNSAKEDAELIYDHNLKSWTPDKVVKAAILKYEEIQKKWYPTARILIALKRTLMQSAIYFENLAAQTEILMKANDKLVKSMEDTVNPQILEAVSISNGLIATNVEAATSHTKSLPEALKRLDDLEAKVREEITTQEEKVGGGLIFDRENPNRK